MFKNKFKTTNRGKSRFPLFVIPSHKSVTFNNNVILRAVKNWNLLASKNIFEFNIDGLVLGYKEKLKKYLIDARGSIRLE